MLYRRIIQPLLFALPIERAHRIAILLLQAIGRLPGGRWLLRKRYALRRPELEREVFGRRFVNPIGLAAGFDLNGEVIREAAALGFGFVEVGTVTPRPQPGNPRPRIFRLPRDRAIVHRLGHPNRGLEAAIRQLRRPREEETIVGCNICKNAATAPEQAPTDYLKLFRNLYQYVDYFTVDLDGDDATDGAGCYARPYILSILGPLFDFRRGQNHYRPVMLKISADLSDEEIDRVTEILIETPLDGIVAAGGSRRREGLRTSLASQAKIGGGLLSGEPLTARAIEIVRRIHTRSGGNYPIIGSGGMMSPDDVHAMLEAGADLVQLYTGFIYNGPDLVHEICRSLADDTEAPAGEPTVVHAAGEAVTEEAAAAASAAPDTDEEAALPATEARPESEQK